MKSSSSSKTSLLEGAFNFSIIILFFSLFLSFLRVSSFIHCSTLISQSANLFNSLLLLSFELFSSVFCSSFFGLFFGLYLQILICFSYCLVSTICLLLYGHSFKSVLLFLSGQYFSWDRSSSSES